MTSMQLGDEGVPGVKSSIVVVLSQQGRGTPEGQLRARPPGGQLDAVAARIDMVTGPPALRVARQMAPPSERKVGSEGPPRRSGARVENRSTG